MGEGPHEVLCTVQVGASRQVMLPGNPRQAAPVTPVQVRPFPHTSPPPPPPPQPAINNSIGLPVCSFRTFQPPEVSDSATHMFASTNTGTDYHFN